MSQLETDQILLQAIKAGQESAFKTIYDKYYRSLVYTAYRTYPDEHKSKDFAQEVFLDLWRKRAEIKIHTSLAAFLKRAVINKTINYIRAQRISFEENPKAEVSPVILEKEDNTDALKTLIHKTAEQLPKRCRMIFFMSRFEGLTHREIAQNLEISEKTIENQITKALKILRGVVTRYLSEAKIFILFYLFS